MDKRDYLIKTFSRTKKKDFENYILTAIWHKLDNLNLKPVSQQYVKRPGEGHALMDLYFPQLHIGIEVDEEHHKRQIEEDKLRMDDIISAVQEEDIADFQILRIDASLPLLELQERIDQVVKTIKDKSAGKDLKWNTYEEDLALAKEQDYLSIYDEIAFKDIKDIANTVFGKSAKRYGRSYFRVTEDTWLWCPKLSIVEEGELKSMAAGWLNILAEDWSYIDESNQDKNIVAERTADFIKEKQKQLRAVFAKYKDNFGFNRYRFVGVFRVSGISPVDSNYLRCERIADKVEIVK